MIYSNEELGKDKFRRVFKENVDSEELIWHRDREDRFVFVESGSNWMLQMDNDIPVVLQEGLKYFIPKMTYHRVIKGTGDLKIVIDESIGKVRIPESVKNNIKKGLKYLRNNRKSYHMFERISNSDSVNIEVLKEFKQFFDSHKTNVVLSESKKGKPHEDRKYVEWLLRGGNAGYNWVLREIKKRV
jgi:hypothetical protein